MAERNHSRAKLSRYTVGDRVEITRNKYSGHGFAIGTEGTVTKLGADGNSALVQGTGEDWWVDYGDMKHVKPLTKYPWGNDPWTPKKD